MSRFMRHVVTAASLAVVLLASVNIASASPARNAIERRQHPGRGFYVRHNGQHTGRIYQQGSR
jgi:hypothetical protein